MAFSVPPGEEPQLIVDGEVCSAAEVEARVGAFVARHGSSDGIASRFAVVTSGGTQTQFFQCELSPTMFL